jgi:putative FmdB family regulatory protein
MSVVAARSSWLRFFVLPVYEYQCEAYQHRFDLRQGYDAETVTDCPVCGAQAKRRISLVPVIFKGSGWYVTDYKGGNSTLKDRGSGDQSGEADASAEGSPPESAKPKDEPKGETQSDGKSQAPEKSSSEEAKTRSGASET